MGVFASESDCESYVGTSDSEDRDDNESEFSGHALSILSSLDESIRKIDDYFAYDRGFLPGDIVSSISDPSGQLGRVVDIDMTVDLETNSGKLIKDINSKKLLRMKSFVSGDYVIYGPWLGKVLKAYDSVTILFDDGASCTIMTGEETLTSIFPSQSEDSLLTFYPGQHVRIKLPTFSKSVRWLCGSWKDYRDTGMISSVEVGSVHVNWVACVRGAISSSSPSSVQDPHDLTLLSCFPHTSWQLGDWCIIISDNLHNQMMQTGNSSPMLAPQHFNKMEKLAGDDISCMQLCVVVKRKAMVNVQWQNGSYVIGLDSQSLCPVNNVGDHEFWPGQFVLEKVSPVDLCALNRERLGIVDSVNARERTVNVKWKVTDGEPTKYKFIETVSAYELIEHPDFSYFFGDVVLRLLSHMESEEESLSEVKSSLQNWREDASFKGFSSRLAFQKDISNGKKPNVHLSCIGNVIGFKDEAIEVRWASGHVSLVQHSVIYVLDKLNEPTMLIEESFPENFIEEGATQGRTSLLREKSLNVLNGANENDRQKSAKLFPHYIVRCFRNMATSLFGQHCLTSLSCQRKGFSNLQILKTPEKKLDLEDLLQENHELQLVEDTVNEQPKYLLGNENPIKFKQFDIVFDCSDHYFVNGFDKGSILYQVKRGWLKKIQEEWTMLKNNLPGGIYVRAYEERIDLLRVCIAGSAGTPYHDGLFLFDFFIPPEYPHEPPVVHFISGGFKLNPNLYESGKVCLSLLRTWTGTGTETWNPVSSTILQVLLSLQALVLNDKPYFNEAGYDKQIGKAEGAKNSVSYNENAFLLSCKSMMNLIQKPPKHFEELIEEHFAWRSAHILMACKAYMNGAQVGFAFEPGAALEGSSAGFKIMLEKLFPKLIETFTEKGINCS